VKICKVILITIWWSKICNIFWYCSIINFIWKYYKFSNFSKNFITL